MHLPVYLFFSFLLACAPLETQDAAEQTDCFSARVVGVKDGDTVEVLDNQNKTSVVRLAHIDTPEKKQAYSQEAKQYLSGLCFGQQVQVCQTDRPDRNGRLIATIELSSGKTANYEMVRAGLAWHFSRYSDDADYAKAEQAARKARLGLWQDPNPIAPWDWRKGERE
jgi:endonuclease YncB( thermonuclease family)